MATSAAAIQSAIVGHLTTAGFDLANTHSWMNVFIGAVAAGVYDELQNLDDLQGSPPSTGHQ